MTVELEWFVWREFRYGSRGGIAGGRRHKSQTAQACPHYVVLCSAEFVEMEQVSDPRVGCGAAIELHVLQCSDYRRLWYKHTH